MLKKKMRIVFKKLNPVLHELKIVRADKSEESTVLETDTYQLHDICHFFVERELETKEGFWGMLSQGYKMEQLSGKTNTLTEKLRLIECIVGATQSVYSGHMTNADFWNYMETVDWDLPADSLLVNVIPKIREFMEKWKYLPIGNEICLEFKL